ncbi:MAG: ABC transporter ATP-binding protein [Spirochaetes bacterium]|nr:ABC transporter ATP-binding protein [Spirochaetota bacterium]
MPELLRFEALGHRFPDGGRGLEGITLAVSDGEFLIVAGRNGSGKTLLMRHAVGLAKPSEGRVLFRGKPVRDELKAVRAAVGYVFQDADAQMIGRTAAEDVAFGPANLRLPPDEIGKRTRAALDAADLAWAGDRSPDTLSGGERRRLAVAGVLAMEPECVILDEPFANLDYPSIRSTLSLIAGIHRAGRTVVLLTHELEKVLAHATRLVVMDAGRIAFDGDPDAFPKGDFERYGLVDPWRRPERRSDLSWL